MSTIVYCSPFVPVEWLAAHGLQPVWWRPARSRLACKTNGGPDERRQPLRYRMAAEEAAASDSSIHGRRGVCPLAAAIVDTAPSAAAVVLTTTCDQLRYAASWLEHQQQVPTFVMNVPSTWQTETARALYLAELVRLSRFLVDQGGTRPSSGELIRVMRQFDAARCRLRRRGDRLSSRQLAAALIAVRESATPVDLQIAAPPHPSSDPDLRCNPSAGPRLPLALVGGPLTESDYDLFDWIWQAGGRIVLDATEWGERTLPRAFAIEPTPDDPLAELADAYFGTIPAVFRRPHRVLYDYLDRELSGRQVRGLIVRRYVWCDLWHAEVAPLKAWSPVPVLDLEAADSEASAAERTRGRIEAFLEMLR